ncbi:hypothetical protein HYQ44_006200 [Verticillium longisporum]|nr:hypothetical protein HYQ44_006200 [Verticillium longisporum]
MDYSNAYHAPIYQDAYVLVPHISITPEARTWDNSGDVLWTAIEITGQVRQSSNSQPAFSQHAGCEGIAIPDPFRYGLLFDIRINIQPLMGAFIIELLQDDPIPTTLYAGSTILILAHIRLKSQPASIVSSISASRQQSDDLMDDLEFHLDSSVRDHLSISLTIV